MNINRDLESATFREIDDSGDQQRLDNYLFKILKGVPKSNIYKIIRKGNVRVNKKRIDAHYKLQKGDILRLPPIRVSKQEEIFLPTDQMAMIKASIIHEDDGLMIINKPSGFPVHGGSGSSYGIIDLLRLAFPTYKNLELAHRLDKETSGCLIVAKKRAVLRELHDLFREGRVKKIYQALCQGCWKSEFTRVDVPLVKNQLESGERIVKVDDEGKIAISEFQSLERFSDASLVKVKIETGRTHQIRVHARYCQHVLAGDDKYGDKKFNARLKKLGLNRLFLHASELSFKLSGQPPIFLKVPLPADLLEILQRLRDELSPERARSS